ncbi:unnamed protein product [Closterium sp. NIES-65]|nr:unnamed protein product [Closterium sp. NIES-65]
MTAGVPGTVGKSGCQVKPRGEGYGRPWYPQSMLMKPGGRAGREGGGRGGRKGRGEGRGKDGGGWKGGGIGLPGEAERRGVRPPLVPAKPRGEGYGRPWYPQSMLMKPGRRKMGKGEGEGRGEGSWKGRGKDGGGRKGGAKAVPVEH